MKSFVRIAFFMLFTFAIKAQDQTVLVDGTVTYVSAGNVYVRFLSTENINEGDTLFVNRSDQLLPELVVEKKSSSSTVCNIIGTLKLKKNDSVVAKTILLFKPLKKEKKKQKPVPAKEEKKVINNDPVIQPDEEDREEEVLFKEKIKGRISVASYSNFSEYNDRTRMRYAFSFRGHNLKNSRFSTESYITFRHILNDSINIAEALKVYKLNVKYEFSTNSSVSLGRKINPKFSSMGVIDGLQLEKGLGSFSVGAIGGSRPDYRDYSVNFDLLQFGAYVSHSSANSSKYSQTTLGVIEQMNKGNTDRRFVYFQHSGTLTKDVNFFASMEVDLFENINNEKKNTARLTNLYTSLQYRVSPKFRVRASYDNRRNIIYYESYKNFIDQLIEDETRQGLRLGFNHRPVKKFSWGVNSSIRFQKSQQNPSKSLSGFFTFSKIPGINARMTLRTNFLQTDYLQSQVFGARLAKELIPGKLSGDIYYRWVDYKYKSSGQLLHQNIGGASLSFRIQKRLSLHLFYEGVFEEGGTNPYHRINAKIIRRF